MKAFSIRILSTAALCALVSACSQGAQATPTATLSPSATFTPTQAITSTVTETVTLAMTETPTSTPEGPIGEFEYGTGVAIYYERSVWQFESYSISHRTFTGCKASVNMRASEVEPGLPQVHISGFIWEVRESSGGALYILNISGGRSTGYRYADSIDVEFGSNPSECRATVEALLASVHSSSTYAQKGECFRSNAKTRMVVGKQAHLLIDTNLRSEPRWGNEFVLRLVGPADGVVDVIGGPMCGLTPYGEYYYWQVKLASGEIGWVAEGDASQYFIEETK